MHMIHGPTKTLTPDQFKLILIPFLFIHGLIFLGVGYFFSARTPEFMIIHSGLGIFVYLVFLSAAFPQTIKDAIISAVLSIATGLIFGDFLIDNFYPTLSKSSITIFHRIYSIIVVFYIYIYLTLIKNWFFSKFENKLNSDESRT